MAIASIYNELVLLDEIEESLPYWEKAVSPTLLSSGYRLTQKRTASLQYTRRVAPTWTIVAILLFPIGLLALLVKNESSLIVTFDPYGGGTLVKISGDGSRRTKKWLDGLSDQLNEIARAAAEEDDEEPLSEPQPASS